jgi:pilus assembly protein FimV
MLDIQRLNPEAFIGNNVNRLKAGYVLRLPSADQISNNNREEAIAEIALQTERWQAAKEGRRLDASEDAGDSGVSSSDESGGRLQIAGAEEAPGSSGYGALEQEVTANLENLDRAQRDNADMRARIEAMEDQVATLQRLLTLKDDQIAALQGAVSESGEMDEELAGTIAAIDEEAAQAESEIEGAASETAAEAAAEPAPVEQPAPVQPAPVVQQEGGILATIMDNLLYVLLGVVFLVALVVLAIRRRAAGDSDIDEDFDTPQRYVDSDDEFANVELGDDGLIVDEFQDEEARPDEMDSEPQGFSSDEDMYAARFESGDALAEADIYIAYGRYPQAADVLKSAIAIEPVNTELRLKLMEACAEMAEREEFQQQYADLQLIGDEGALDKGRDYLEIVDGGEMWLEDLPNPSITMAEIDAARARQAEGALKAEPMVEFMPHEEVEEETVADAVDEIAGDGADFDLDLDSDDLDAALDVGAGMAAIGDDEDKVDLDLNLEIEEIKASSPAAEAAANTNEVLANLDEVDLDASIEAGEDDLSFDMADLKLGDADSAQASADAGSSLDDMELEDIGGAGTSFDGSVEPELELADELDGELLTEFGELTIEGEESVGLEQPDLDQSLNELTDSLTAGSEASDFSAEDAEGDDGEMVFASNGDETATKLDLARAYMDMGDQDGARSILEEVAKDGDDGQKQEARSLLDSIA